MVTRANARVRSTGTIEIVRVTSVGANVSKPRWTRLPVGSSITWTLTVVVPSADPVRTSTVVLPISRHAARWSVFELLV